MRRKALLFSLSALIAVSFTACGSNSSKQNVPAVNKETQAVINKTEASTKAQSEEMTTKVEETTESETTVEATEESVTKTEAVETVIEIEQQPGEVTEVPIEEIPLEQAKNVIVEPVAQPEYNIIEEPVKNNVINNTPAEDSFSSNSSSADSSADTGSNAGSGSSATITNSGSVSSSSGSTSSGSNNSNRDENGIPQPISDKKSNGEDYINPDGSITTTDGTFSSIEDYFEWFDKTMAN